MRDQLAAETVARINRTLSRFRLDDISGFHAVRPDDFGPRMTNLIQLWLIGKGLHLDAAEAEGRQALRVVLHEFVRGVLFKDADGYLAWGDTQPTRGAQNDLRARRELLNALVTELAERPPDVALQLIQSGPDPGAVNDYEALRSGLPSLLDVLAAAGNSPMETTINGRRVFISTGGGDWPKRCAAWSPAFLSTRLPAVWLHAGQMKRLRP